MPNKPNRLNKPEFQYCDFSNVHHCEKVIELINHYMTDPMGGCEPLDNKKGQMLVKGLSAHPSSFVLFILYNQEIAGLSVCFINFSTFKALPYINIHDIIIKKEFRGIGLGKALLEKIISIADEKGYCKVNLEVRDDNTNAKQLYKSLGFCDTEPVMYFWTKVLE